MPSASGSSPIAARGMAAEDGDTALRALTAPLAVDLVAIHLSGATAVGVPLALHADGSPVPLDVATIDLEVLEAGAGRLLVARVGDPFPGARGEVVLTVGDGDDAVRRGPAPLVALGAELQDLVRERLAGLGRPAREALLEQVVELAGRPDATRDPLGLSLSMTLLRDALREPLPPCVVALHEPQGLHVDSVVALDDTAFYVRGWVIDQQAPLRRLTIVSPEGARVELLPALHRIPRPDVDQFYARPDDPARPDVGFVAAFETPAPSLAPDGWIMEMENDLGVGKEVTGPAPIRDVLAARGGILADLERERRPSTPLMKHAVQAISRIQERLERLARIEEVVEYGTPPADPDISVVVPLYGRIDFLEHQLAQFVDDPEIAAVDLVYVLDSPQLAPALLQSAAELHALYGVPFRVAIMNVNGGFSVANNRAAEHARGRLLVLLNSDVLPAEPGWLSRMAAFYDQQPDIGALGVKLLFEDGSLQHAGICFERPPGAQAWENAHFHKGLHGSLPAANVTRRVPAVTGACLMIDRELYQRVGGLHGMYVQGDYEDTDLCLRLAQEGRETWYLPEVELYHLEGQSYQPDTRRAMARYNIWLHSWLWGEQIEQLMADPAVAGDGRTSSNA